MHANRRYVKLAWIGLVTAGLLASPAQAELVAAISTRGVLAAAADSAPVVAYTDRVSSSSEQRVLVVARRPQVGVWRSTRVASLPLGVTYLAGMVVDARGRPSVLAEDLSRGRLVLAQLTAQDRWRVTVLVTTRRDTQLGRAGIVLDPAGLPVVAYAVRRPTGATYLRLVRVRRDGRFRTSAVTLNGFPSSARPPAATPVLVGRTIHVVQAFGATAIDWAPRGKTWEGQVLMTSRFGATVGEVAAASRDATLHAALTLELPEFEQSNVVAIASSATQSSRVVFPHALLAGLAVAPTGVEVAANDFVPTSGGSVFAGLVSTPAFSVEVDGRIDAYRALDEGSRYLLLAHPGALEFYAVPALLPVSVRFDVSTIGNTVSLSGAVTGARGREVELYRETPSERIPLLRPPLHSDGSFAAVEGPLPSGVVYRAVFREPTTGLPYAALFRTPCCASLPR